MNDVETLSINPNPTANSATLFYHLSAEERVSVAVYDVVGRCTSRIADGEMQPAGAHSYELSVVAAGVYFVKFTVGEQVVTVKLVKL